MVSFLGANKFAPIVHEVDTSDVGKWDENIFEPARVNFEEYLNGTNRFKIVEDDTGFEKESKFEYNKCEDCEKVFVDKFQWKGNLNNNFVAYVSILTFFVLLIQLI